MLSSVILAITIIFILILIPIIFTNLRKIDFAKVESSLTRLRIEYGNHCFAGVLHVTSRVQRRLIVLWTH